MGLFQATVKLDFPIGSGGGTNTWSLRTISADGSTTEVAALMGLVEDFYLNCSGFLPSSFTASWDGLVRELAVPDPALLEAATPWTTNGTASASDYGPAPAMACVSWRSALATRRGRGRTFIGPIDASFWESNGTLATDAVTALRSAASTLVSASLSDTNGALVVWSELDGVGRDFVASSVTDQAAVLRSRR